MANHDRAELRPPSRYIPTGVDAGSWLGFEQRIQERRYQALLDTASAAMAAGDVDRARAAMVEARELRPSGEALAQLEANLALMVPDPAALAATARSSWTRGAGAALLFVVGVSMVMAMDWVRTPPVDSQPATPQRASRQPAARQGASPATVLLPDAPAPAAAPSASEAVPDERAVAVPLEVPTPVAAPALPEGVPVATVGRDARDPLRVARPSSPAGDRSSAASGLSAGSTLSDNTSAVTPAGPTVTPTPQEERPRIVAPAPGAGTLSGGSTVSGPSAGPASGPAVAPTAEVGPAVAPVSLVSSVSSGALDRTRVADVLNAYADAYARLDARAAHRVWPAVDERALARAFAGLSSQSLAFDDCAIDVRGERAEVSCRGRASYVGKVGRRDARTEPREWRFSLRREGESWQIQRAEALRP